MILIRACLILLLSFIMLSCSKDPHSSGVSALNKAAPDQAAPAPVTIVPQEATRKAQLTLRAESAILTGGKIQWYINGGQKDEVNLYAKVNYQLNHKLSSWLRINEPNKSPLVPL